MGFMQEFKQFAMRGNVVDLAVGVVIGTAFGKIVSSLVQDVIMPPLGAILGGVDFQQLHLTISSQTFATLAEAEAAAKALADTKAEVADVLRRLDVAKDRYVRAPHTVHRAVAPIRVPHAVAVLPDAVAAMVADGWVDVTHAVVAVPAGSRAHGVHKPPAAGAFAALAQY